MDEAPSTLALLLALYLTRSLTRSLARSLARSLPSLSYTLSISALPILVHISPSLSPPAISSLLLVCFSRCRHTFSFFPPSLSLVPVPPFICLADAR